MHKKKKCNWFTCGGKCKVLFSQLGIYSAHKSGWMTAQHFGTFLSPSQLCNLS